jgi:uncharacterized tellurite resistance protein B-like protein
MRHYPSDSPQAMARLLALALLADGLIDTSELDLLDDRRTVASLGLDSAGFDEVFYRLCADMLRTGQRMTSGRLDLDADTIDRMLDEVRNPLLRKKTLRAMIDIVHADRQLAGGEAALIARALKRWALDMDQLAANSAGAKRLSRRNPQHALRA